MDSFGGTEVQSGNSFTALLELSPIQASELLHSAGAIDFAGDVQSHRQRIIDQIPYIHTLNCSLPFPSNTALIERAAKYSVFATGGPAAGCFGGGGGVPGGGGRYDSPETSSAPYSSNGNALKMKNEPADSNSNPNLDSQVSYPTFVCQIEKTSKRKEREKKGEASVKKSKAIVNESSGDGEKLPFIHVRARRGQATDSHSLAERARREKINARMKLLQDLVPGCNKISSTALVLDQIINHVQNLQRQVEYLSMKIAAVDPRTDFNLDSLLGAVNGSLMGDNFQSMMMPFTWPEIQMNGDGQQGQEQWAFDSIIHPDWVGEEDQCNLITPENSLLSYDSSGN